MVRKDEKIVIDTWVLGVKVKLVINPDDYQHIEGSTDCLCERCYEKRIGFLVGYPRLH